MTLHRGVYGFIVLALLLALIPAQVSTAQGSEIEFVGTIQAVEAETITVNGIVVNVSSAEVAVSLEVGVVVRVRGTLLENGSILATRVEAAGQEPALLNAFQVSFQGRTYDAAANRTTFAYRVTGTGTPPDLSHFDLEIPACDPALEVVGYSPAEAVSFGVDPTTGVSGIKWDLPLLSTDSRSYSVTFQGSVVEGTVLVAVYGGGTFETASLPGPSCAVPMLDVEKFVSVDGGVTWQDADAPPGPDVDLDGQVSFRFVVTNSGDVPLSSLTLTDSALDVSGCVLPESLGPGAFFECTVGPLAVVQGQHSNTATASGAFEGSAATDTDSAHYFGGDRPSIDVEKLVSIDGGATWEDADSAPGPSVEVGADVSFRFVVTNDGNVALGSLSLGDDTLDVSSCAPPDALDPGASFECAVGPLPAAEGQHTNTATASGSFEGTVVSDTDAANYLGGEEELPVVIVIEGPVAAININIITIYDFDIELDPDDPILTVLRVGDRLRVEGSIVEADAAFVIVVVNIVFIDVEVFVSDDGQVWRDPGNCANAPPPWAPAHGWRRRCEGSFEGSGSRS